MNKNAIGKINIAFTLAEMLVILTVFSVIAASTLPIMTASQKVGNVNNSITGETSEIVEFWTKTENSGMVYVTNPHLYYAPDTTFSDSTVAIGTGDNWPNGTPTNPQPRLMVNKNTGSSSSIMNSSQIAFLAYATNLVGTTAPYPAGRIALMDNNIALGYNALWDTTGSYGDDIGVYNIAIGSNAMVRNAGLTTSTEDEYNIAIGKNAFYGGVGAYNISLGPDTARYLNGTHSISIGYYANNNIDAYNGSIYATVIGNYAGVTHSLNKNNRTHAYSILIGDSAGRNTSNTSSIFLGYFAGSTLVGTNLESIAIGTYAGANFVPLSERNIHIGKFSGWGTKGSGTLSDNIFIGPYASAESTYNNTKNVIGIGKYVLKGATAVNNDSVNIGLYAQAYRNETTAASTDAPVVIGNYATSGYPSAPAAVSIGNYAGYGNLMSTYSIFIGNYAGLGTYSRNRTYSICIGKYACAGAQSAINVIRIGHLANISKSTNLGQFASYIGSWLPEGGTSSSYTWWSNTNTYPTLLISTNGGSSFSSTSILLYSNYIFARNSVFTVFSDKRLKENIKASKYSLKDLRKINVYEYNFKDDKSKDLQIGVIAQELKKIIPQAVTTNPFNGYLAVDTSWIMYTVVNSVKELDLKVQKISASLSSYTKEFVSLATRVETLEKEVSVLERENKYLTSQVNAEYKKFKAKGK